MRASHIVVVLFATAAMSSASAGEAAEKRTLLSAFDNHSAETQRLAMTRVRTLGIACEVYASVYNRYPVGKFGAIEQLTGKFVPEFLPEALVKGPWGETIYYWSEGRDYVIIAPGKDGKLDVDYAALLAETAGGWDNFKAKACPGARNNIDGDLVWLDGAFCASFKEGDT
jgi:hypothetical protein